MPTHTLDKQLHNQLSSFTLNHHRNVVSQIKPIDIKIVLFNKVTIFFWQKIVRLKSQPSAFDPKKISCLKTFLSQVAAIFFRPAIFFRAWLRNQTNQTEPHTKAIFYQKCAFESKETKPPKTIFFVLLFFGPECFRGCLG